MLKFNNALLIKCSLVLLLIFSCPVASQRKDRAAAFFSDVANTSSSYFGHIVGDTLFKKYLALGTKYFNKFRFYLTNAVYPKRTFFTDKLWKNVWKSLSFGKDINSKAKRRLREAFFMSSYTVFSSMTKDAWSNKKDLIDQILSLYCSVMQHELFKNSQDSWLTTICLKLISYQAYNSWMIDKDVTYDAIQLDSNHLIMSHRLAKTLKQPPSRFKALFNVAYHQAYGYITVDDDLKKPPNIEDEETK